MLVGHGKLFSLASIPLRGDPARFADQIAILDGGYPVAVPSGARAKTVRALF